MTVLFFTPSFLPRVGGVERHVAAVSRELIKKGYRVSIITGSGEQPDWPSEVITLPPFTGPLRLCKIWGWLWQHRRLWQQADIIHGHDFPSYYWTWPLRLAMPKPFYLTFHGWEGVVPPRRSTIWLRRWAERGAAGTIAVGQFIAKWYQQQPNFTTYGGVDQPTQPLPKRTDPNRAIFIGQLRPDTGIEDYLAACRTLIKNRVLRRVDVFGDGPLRGSLEQMAERARLPIVFHGPGSQPINLFATGRYAFVSGYLGMLEALAAGSVVIAYAANPLKDDYLRLSPFHPFIKETTSPEEIVRAITVFQKQPAAIRRISEAGQAFAAKQTWARVAETYEQLWLTKKLA